MTQAKTSDRDAKRETKMGIAEKNVTDKQWGVDS